MDNNKRNHEIIKRLHPNQIKQLLLDPNAGNENVPIENLNIECDLSVYERSRSFIGVEENNDGKDKRRIAELKEKAVPFNQGTKYGEDFSLTTNYTEVSSNDYDGDETLGITSVNIEYNSSFMPLITIELTDVRGKMFEKGKNGPYSPFFNFPYPLFELRIKGYYGKPVIYLLHMTNFTSKMDSENGNFQITCSFNGYTYAYLSDMLLGYLKAVPYTRIGEEIVHSRRLEDPNFVTFDELYEYATKINEEIIDLQYNDGELQALALGHQMVDDLANIKNTILARMKALDSKSFNIKRGINDILLVRTHAVEGFNSPLEAMQEYLSENVVRMVREYNINVEDTEYTLNEELYEPKNLVNHFKGMSLSSFLDSNGEILLQNNTKIPKDEDFNKIARYLKSVSFNLTRDTTFHLIYLKDIMNEIDSNMESIKNQLQKGEAVKRDEVFNRISNLEITDSNGRVKTFDFNLKNYTKVLCDHVDILMEAIKRVGGEAEANDTRNQELRGNEDLYDIKTEWGLDKIYAFPDYRVKEDTGTSNRKSAFVDEWIGKDHPDIDEVIFIEELHQGIINAKKEEEVYKTQLEETNSQWFGVNPFDSMVFMNRRNPYENVANTSGEDGHILRLLTLRAIIFLGLTVRTPQADEITAMARLEANNIFRNLLNIDVKDFMSELGNDPNEISNKIREYVNAGNTKLRNDLHEINHDNILQNKERDIDGYFKWGAESPKSYEDYVYIGDNDNGEMKFFVPLHFHNSNGKPEIYNGNSLMNINNDVRKQLRESGTIFFGDYMGNHLLGNDKPDVGATYIKILEESDLDLNVRRPDYGGKILDKYNIKSGFTWEYQDLKSGNFSKALYNGKFQSNEFMRYSRDGRDYDFLNYFYGNETIATIPPELEFLKSFKFTGFVNRLIMGTGSGEVQRKFSLFGSNHYYAQNDFGKAYLFLSSIPFKRDGHNIFNSKEILGLFDTKASTVEVPYSWILHIGSILHRVNEEILVFEKDGIQTLQGPLEVPEQNEILAIFSANPSHYSDGISDYGKIDVVLEKLPDNVKDIFIKEFIDWVNGDFQLIRRELEIFDVNTIPNEDALLDYWLGMTDTTPLSDVIRDDFHDNYETITALRYDDIGREFDKDEYSKEDMLEMIEDHGNMVNFGLKLKEGSSSHMTLVEFLNERRYLVNATWRIWANDIDKWWHDNRIEGNTYPITFRTDNLNLYLKELVIEFKKLVKNFHDDDLRRREVFGSSKMSEIYLTMYKNIKSINDKWVSGENAKVRESFNNLIDTFKFIDRGYNDIGTEFKLNPMHITTLLTSNYNNSFYAHISKVLTNNNFDFIPMPNYVNMHDEGELSKVFETNSYNSSVATSAPSFVCMYVGEKSNRLEVGDNFPGDGINFGNNENELPDDFDKVPAILIRYGDQNQSIFKSIQLDQSEFSETNESLMTTDQIASSYNNINNVGQNIFDVYNNRAYNAVVESLGNAMLQPFMYFQLDNIPMFRGGYIITKVSHNITPNHMTTSFKGNRVKFVKTKLLDKEAIFSNMIGNFSDIRTGNSSIDDLESLSQREPVMPLITANMTNPEIYKTSFRSKDVSTSTYDNASNTKKNGSYMTYNEIFKEVSDLTGVPVLTLQVMSTMESAAGTYKGPNGMEMNELGYVGLMQFGLYAAQDVVNLNINDIVFNKIDVAKYGFHAVVDRDNKKMKFPSSWSSNPTLNNKNTNSWFDDYISALSSALYAIHNSNRLGSSLSHVPNIYLSHQQGAGGLRSIINNQNNRIDGNAANNLPPHNKNVRYNQEWYLAWAAHVEATGKRISDDYEIIIGKDIV